MDIFDWMDCEYCPHRKLHRGRASGDPGNCYPDVTVCSDGDFGNDHPCGRMLARIEEGLRDGDFAFSRSFLVDSRVLAASEAKEEYGDVLSAWPDVDWSKHLYWRIFYDETAPTGFDTVGEVYEEVFQ